MPPDPILHIERRVELVAAQFVNGADADADVAVLLRLSSDGTTVTFEADSVRATFDALHLRTAFLLLTGELPAPPEPTP
jgi:hypothetical protein